jgi:site-specific recombinase XerD
MKRPAGCLRARMWCSSNCLLYSCIHRAVTPHVLRHTFSVTAMQKGIPLPALQRQIREEAMPEEEADG